MPLSARHTSERFGIPMTQENQTTQVLRYRIAYQESRRITTTDKKTKKEKTVTHLYRKFTDKSSVGVDGVAGLLDFCKDYNAKHKGVEASVTATVEVFRVKVKDD